MAVAVCVGLSLSAGLCCEGLEGVEALESAEEEVKEPRALCVEEVCSLCVWTECGKAPRIFTVPHTRNNGTCRAGTQLALFCWWFFFFFFFETEEALHL